MQFGAIEWLNGLWLMLAVALLVAYAIWRAQQQLSRFIAPAVATRVTVGFSPRRRILKGLLLACALGLMCFGLARPQWNPQPEEITRVGRDVCFVLDVSRSMQAEDLAPNRLDRAKLWINDVAGILEGDRVALIAFAGTSVVKCPLTHDYGFFRLALEETDMQSVSRGGTLIGDVVRVALRDVFDVDEDDTEREARHRDIILITDGEDHESLPVEAAQVAGEAGVRIIAIGIGDPDVGTPIPLDDGAGRPQYLTYEGEIVQSRLDAEMLAEMARATPDGVFLSVATGDIALDEIYRDLVQDAEQKTLAEGTVMRYDEKFQIFLGLGLTLLIMETLISDSRRRRFSRAQQQAQAEQAHRGPQKPSQRVRFEAGGTVGGRNSIMTTTIAGALAALMLAYGTPLSSPTASAQITSPQTSEQGEEAAVPEDRASEELPFEVPEIDAQGRVPAGSAERQARLPDGASLRSEIRRGNSLYADGNYAAALEAYENAIGLDSASPEAKFNAGCAHYALGEYDEALRRFRDTVATPGTESELLDQAEYNIGRTLLERGQRDLQSNPQQAMQSLEQAEELFEGVARQRPEDRDAVRNLEFTRQTLRNLRDEMRRQEQMQQAQQQIADDLNELAEEQEEQAQSSQSPQTPQSEQPQPQPQQQQQQQEPESDLPQSQAESQQQGEDESSSQAEQQQQVQSQAGRGGAEQPSETPPQSRSEQQQPGQRPQSEPQPQN
ncbi:MAG: vWA domain-containing protein, partial [Planctomycetota bacterium]